MLILLIDTSTERGLVAIFKETTPLFQRDLPFGLQNSTHLLPTIREALTQTKLDMHQLQAIAVGIGPGSYTGIRVGAMVAKSLSYACKVPLVGICSLEGYVPTQDCSFAALIDAKIGGAYLLKGQRLKGAITFTTQPELCELDKLPERLTDVTTIITPQAQRLRPLLPGQWEWQERAPDALTMVKHAILKVNAKEVSTNGNLELLYLRKTQAEIERSNS